ncbi:MAG TPA: zf-HC2 domain-containing protein [Steroidobacteraceae bacterium]|nr:zf-HC2 domain-containing protein [Steroidobacteraceae bacterium]
MEHLHFTTNQTAAAYVARRLDPGTQEAFELHLMECGECLREVESWRAIKDTLRKYTDIPHEQIAAIAGEDRAPREPFAVTPLHSARPAVPRQLTSVEQVQSTAPAGSARARTRMQWSMAAAVAGALALGAAGGWSARSVQTAGLDADSTAFYSLPPVARGPADCLTAALAPATRQLALRVPGAAPDQQLVAVDSEGHDLAADDYVVRTQADGSWLVRMRAKLLREQGIRFEARSADGTAEPRGCVQSTPRE